jgi:tRNA 2-thiouridine synthesizing protein B
MSTLNIINKSPFEKRTLDQCISRIGSDDGVLLIEDAVVAAVSGTALSSTMETTGAQSKLYVLSPDLDARGFASASLLDCVQKVDYAGFVDLVVSHDRVHSWL